jgi:hypothetical protein
MKIGELKSFGHNIADSLGSGCCFMIGLYGVDIYGEASSAPEGHIIVDFISGSATGSPASASLQGAVQKYAKALPDLCNRHGIDLSEIKTLSARFGIDPVAGAHFSVTVEALDGRGSVDQYVGFPGRRFSKSRKIESAA